MYYRRYFIVESFEDFLMFRAEVRAPAADFETLYNAVAGFFRTELPGSAIHFVFILEFTSFAQDIAVIRH